MFADIDANIGPSTYNPNQSSSEAAAHMTDPAKNVSAEEASAQIPPSTGDNIPDATS